MDYIDKSLTYIGIAFLIFMIIFGLSIAHSISLKDKACESFGGKLTSGMECYKFGTTYKIVNTDIWGYDYRISSTSVNSEVKEE